MYDGVCSILPVAPSLSSVFTPDAGCTTVYQSARIRSNPVGLLVLLQTSLFIPFVPPQRTSQCLLWLAGNGHPEEQRCCRFVGGFEELHILSGPTLQLLNLIPGIR